MPCPKNEELNKHRLIRRPEGRDPTENLLTVTECAVLRGTSYGCAIADIWRGRLPAWSVGGIYLIPRRDAEDWARRPDARMGMGKKKALQRINRAIDKEVQKAIEEGRIIKRSGDTLDVRHRTRDLKPGCAKGKEIQE